MITKLEVFHIDIIKELGNVGSGNALVSLGKLINKRIDMQVPKINILEYKEVAELMGGADKPVISILLDINGDIKGNMMFILEEEYAFSLLSILRKKNIKDISELTDMDISALKEVGNILSGSYLSALAKLCKLDIMPSVPHFVYDMAGAILSIPAIELGGTSDNILYIETIFAEDENSVVGKFFLIPDWSSYDVLIKSLGVI